MQPSLQQCLNIWLHAAADWEKPRDHACLRHTGHNCHNGAMLGLKAMRLLWIFVFQNNKKNCRCLWQMISILRNLSAVRSVSRHQVIIILLLPSSYYIRLQWSRVRSHYANHSIPGEDLKAMCLWEWPSPCTINNNQPCNHPQELSLDLMFKSWNSLNVAVSQEWPRSGARHH